MSFTAGLLIGGLGGSSLTLIIMGCLCASGRESEEERIREAVRRDREQRGDVPEGPLPDIDWDSAAGGMR